MPGTSKIRIYIKSLDKAVIQNYAPVTHIRDRIIKRSPLLCVRCLVIRRPGIYVFSAAAKILMHRPLSLDVFVCIAKH